MMELSKITAIASAFISIALAAACAITAHFGLALFTLAAAAVSCTVLRELYNTNDDEEIRKRMEREAIHARNSRDEAEFRMLLDREQLFHEFCKWDVNS